VLWSVDMGSYVHSSRKPVIIKSVTFKRPDLFKLNRIIAGKNSDTAMYCVGKVD